jgi:hypothetical protein
MGGSVFDWTLAPKITDNLSVEGAEHLPGEVGVQ